MRRLMIAATLVALVLPASAEAYTIHNFRIRDAGPEIVARVTVCTKVRPGYEQKFHFRVHVELAEGGGDGHTVPFSGWYGRGCTEGFNRFRDTLLHWEGWYYGRVRVRLGGTDWAQITGWRQFYVQ